MERSYTVREMLGALQRRRWLALAVAVAVLAVGAAVVVLTPSEYQAESVMQIEPHQIPADFFPSSVTSFEERMRTLKHGVLATPVLRRVLEETDFYPDWKREPDEAVDRLRRATEVRLEGEMAGGPPSLLFVVVVRGSDREKVAKAADLIPRAYAEMTRDVLATQAHNLRVTLTKQMNDLSKRLTVEEKKLVAFKTEHAIDLPEANEANMRLAGALNAQIDGHLNAIADAKRHKLALLATIPEVNSDAGLAGGNAEDVLRHLEATRAAYGDDHPDVKRLERQYQEALGRSKDRMSTFKRDRIDAQIAQFSDQIRTDEAGVTDLRKQLDVVEKRLEAAPGWGEQYRALSRDYETLRAKYTGTLSRATDASAAEALLAADAPGLFRVVQAAVPPSRPAGPNRVNLALIALAVALGAAILATVAAEYFDSSLRGAQDAHTFGVPVLASIPRIGPRRAVRQ
jgi:uncharacterized protein involved in exopolysaccharide biosynthesis